MPSRSLFMSIGLLALVLTAQAPAAPGARDPGAIYEQTCAGCHRGGVPRAPHEVNFQLMTSDQILTALTDGVMRQQASGLSHAEKVALAHHLAGSSAADAKPPLACERATVEFESATGSTLTGWSPDVTNHRRIPESIAGLTAADLPNLSLKWAFAYPGASRARGQPAVAGGAIFVGAQDGSVYALDFETGCMRWRFAAEGEVRTAVTVAADGTFDTPLAFFGDLAGHVYAVEARTGRLRWKVRPHGHPEAIITAAPRLHDGRLYVPVSSKEWASAADPGYPCCTFRGAVVALDAATGDVVWQTYTIPEVPAPTGERNESGAMRYGPAGVPVWNSPTIDVARNRLYVGTGEAYVSPAAPTSDAVIAMDLETGERLWHYQSVAGDAWNMACFIGGGPNCPVENGPDFDVGTSPVLVDLPGGRSVVVAGQKSGHVFALDPATGEPVWVNRIGKGGYIGGVHWGMAVVGDTVFAPNADTDVLGNFDEAGKPGLFALDAATGKTRWYVPALDTCAPETRPACDPGLSAPATAIPGAILAGGLDGWLRAYDPANGRVLWEYDTNRPFETISGEKARGGAIEADGPVVVDGVLLVNSGYLFGGRLPGNVLLAFEVPSAP